jgi:hypothetical protein
MGKNKVNIKSIGNRTNRYLSEDEVEALKLGLRACVIKDITSSREKAIAFLKRAGICDENGNLSEIYR